ncbi:single-stranded-DNA-specific exonuclease RecJ [Trichocoleus desertorum AS-A10]|uniref:single-stranded-DNA-specific exonuclease RecJ n=1 Tax=Trichocoleus desertorum TaxID=1481672 RepID=UPI003298C18C
MLVPVSSSPHLSHREYRLPDKRWAIAERNLERVEAIVQATQLSPLLAQVLINRGIATPGQAEIFLDPDLQVLPSPLEDFPDLAGSVELLQEAIANQHKIAICGDYDADGMTSTALLLRALRALGAEVDYAIPSRMSEGYGINERIVEDFHREGVRLILTVDNGIAAVKPIARARELGLSVIVTDHHEVPPEIPPANAILNPKLIHEDSPYRGVAGVGVAYVLAVTLAQQLDAKDLGNLLLELFTLGTIADLAPLTGVNRRWVKRGLQRLPKSQIPGVQALIQVAGLGSSKALKPEAIGFSLGPRINAVGRIADPQVVIELLTTDDMGIALERAMQCEQINQHRQQLCTQIEREAIAWYEASEIDLQDDRVLVIVQPNWHHGVIGIVASRLVERYGVPVFIGTYEDDDQKIRGSARSIPDFHVFEALEFCKEVLEKHGGHQAAGGFTLLAENLEELRSRLRTFARASLQPDQLKPLLAIDVQAHLEQIDLSLYEQIDALHPCGIQNPDPVFWTPNVRVVEQRLIGKDQAHLKVTLSQDVSQVDTPLAAIAQPRIQALAWRWGEYYPLPNRVDIAYKLRVNEWQGNQTVELELVGVRLPSSENALRSPETAATQQAEFDYSDRQYTCGLYEQQKGKELRITNSEGQQLVIQKGQKLGWLLKPGAEAKPVDVSQPFFYQLIKTALSALG